jgi:hypothetical protein
MQDASNFLPVMLESPFSGDFQRNFAYWQAANLHSILVMHEAPISSHFYYTQFLDDSDPDQRNLGITLGFAMWQRCTKTVFYMDLGMSKGMAAAKKRAERAGRPHEMRWLGNDWESLGPKLARGSSELFTKAPSQE